MSVTLSLVYIASSRLGKALLRKEEGDADGLMDSVVAVVYGDSHNCRSRKGNERC